MGNYENQPIGFKVRARPGGGPLGPGAIVGLLLITGGTLLFLDNLAILPFDVTDAFWPLVLIMFGGAVLIRTQSIAVKVWAVTGMVAGALLMLGNYHVIHANADILWPLVLIATGIVMLIYRLRFREFTNRMNLGLHVGSNSKSSVTDNKLQETAIFSGIKRRVEAANFEGGELNCIFGSIELDLRRDGFMTAGRVVVVEANAVFGGIEIRIPETWKLSLQGTAVFGSYEDKTIPPRPESGIDPPTLIVRGGAAFGSVIIRN
jgi:predicted membrane protein